MLEEGKRYIFKKSYTCDRGTIGEGREINLFRNAILMDGLLVTKPFSDDLMALFNDDKFINEYIKIENFSDSSYVI